MEQPVKPRLRIGIPHATRKMRMLGKSDGGSAFISSSRDFPVRSSGDPLIELLTFIFPAARLPEPPKAAERRNNLAQRLQRWGMRGNWHKSRRDGIRR